MDVMLDLETMGVGSDAAIVAIGAVEFSLEKGMGEIFYMPVDLESSVKSGGVIDAMTVVWWMSQSEEARATFKEPSSLIGVALAQFSRWISSLGPDSDIKIWGNGAAFDNVVLSNAYRRYGLPRPWRYSGDRCYRTLKALCPNVPIPQYGTSHCAKDDAVSQAMHTIDILWELKRTVFLPEGLGKTPLSIVGDDYLDQ